ncbi:MAG: hemerythrin domain-containing protein [Candidatus Binatota bacterium]
MRHPSLILLSHDHHHGLALALRCRRQALGQIKPMGAQGLKERVKEYRDFFAQNLVPHFRAEEEILFPLIRARAAESHSLIDELLKDHEQLRKWEECLEEDKGLAKVLFDLGDLLERHIRREERELFPFFENLAAQVDAERIGKEIKEILETRGRPR